MIENHLREVMSTRAGREVMHQILGISEPLKNAYTGESLSTAYECGRRETAIRLTAWLMDYTPDAYILMQQEQLNAVRSSPDAGHSDPDDRHAAVNRDDDRRRDDERAGLRGSYPVPGDDGSNGF